MAYGLRTRAPIENAPAVQVGKTNSSGSSERSWLTLSEACRLEAVE